jgi:hypothetical protein
MKRCARSDSARNARPGGIMNAFCEPEITTSSPHASIGRSYTPIAVIASTTIRRSSERRTICAISRTGCRTAVLVSDACRKTALMSGFASSAAATSAGSTAWPHATSRQVARTP